MNQVLRCLKAAALLAAVIIICVILWLAPFIAIPPALIYFAWLYYLWNKIKSFGILIENDHLVQTDGTGNKTAWIDLNKPYKVNVSFRAFLQAIYTVTQEQSKIQFTSDAENAEHIAVDVLHASKEWPPVGPWNFGW